MKRRGNTMGMETQGELYSVGDTTLIRSARSARTERGEKSIDQYQIFLRNLRCMGKKGIRGKKAGERRKSGAAGNAALTLCRRQNLWEKKSCERRNRPKALNQLWQQKKKRIVQKIK